MLQLLSPAGLWAVAALSLPLAIHLWRPPPRTVRLGSLRFLENLPRRLHDLRWRERWLLAARLALLALLALLLAGPRWQRVPPRGPQRWILLDPTAAPAAGSLARLRALQSAGCETHALAPGFPVVGTMLEKTNVAAPDLWSLLREADAGLPPGSSLAVFSPGRMASLRGSRPALRHCKLEWVPTTDASGEAPPPPGPTPAAAAAPPVVLIQHDADREADARYTAAAVRVASAVDGRAVTIQTRVTDPVLDSFVQADWVFWLSARAVPRTWTGRGSNVVSEAASAGEREGDDFSASWIVPVPDASGATAFADPVRLWRRTAPPAPPPGAVYWTDGFGLPLLTVAREGRGRHWRFYGRFDPAWTDLPRGSAFPAWLRATLFGQGDPPSGDLGRDRRLADPSQCRTSETPPAGNEVTLARAGDDSVDLHRPAWLLAAWLFGAERVLAGRRRPQRVIAAPMESVPVAVLR